MIHLEPNKVKQKEITDTEKKTKKTVILAEVDNGYIFIKRTCKLNDEGYLDSPDNEEESVFVYRENPLEDNGDDVGSSLSEIIENIK